MPTHQELAAIHPGLRLKSSKRARRLALRLDPKERVVQLVVPCRISQKKALAFAASHQRWIAQKLGALPERIRFEDGAVIPVFGQEYLIKVLYDETLKMTDIHLGQNELRVETNREDASGRIARFLKQQAGARIEHLAYEKAVSIGKSISAVQIRDTKSRWGSCGPDGRLSFSWRLIFAPPAALDYLVAHEVAHLVHMNHSRDFWAVCARLSADYRTGKSWMRTYGNELMRYG